MLGLRQARDARDDFFRQLAQRVAHVGRCDRRVFGAWRAAQFLLADQQAAAVVAVPRQAGVERRLFGQAVEGVVDEAVRVAVFVDQLGDAAGVVVAVFQRAAAGVDAF